MHIQCSEDLAAAGKSAACRDTKNMTLVIVFICCIPYLALVLFLVVPDASLPPKTHKEFPRSPGCLHRGVSTPKSPGPLRFLGPPEFGTWFPADPGAMADNICGERLKSPVAVDG